MKAYEKTAAIRFDIVYSIADGGDNEAESDVQSKRKASD